MQNQSMNSMIDNIVEVVLNIHFNYIKDPEMRKDLMQEGYLKAYELLADGNYDPSKNLRTFIYTGVRNAMTNYRYHHNKEDHMSLSETLDNNTWMRSFNNVQDVSKEIDGWYYDSENENIEYEIDVDIVYRVCNKYLMFGDYTNYILNRLNSLGVHNKTYIVPNDFNHIDFVEDCIIGEVLWKMLEV